MYVPCFYEVGSDERTGLQVVTGRTPEGIAAGVPERVGRVYVRDLDAFPFPERFPIPFAEAIFDRASVEVTRGCTEGCRFCQAGIIYRPVRERSPEAIKKAVLEGVDAGGFDETSLTALSTADVSCIDPLIKDLVPELARRKVSLGIASLRAYGLSGELLDEIKSVGITGLTFAPEAGTQRMRDVINKNVTDEDILASGRRLFERGMDRMKMYFIMGLPTETDEDVVGIIETGRRVRELGRQISREKGLPRVPQITCSVSQHVPKPHTPFQWAAMDSMEDLETKVQMLRDLSRHAKVALKTHDVRESWLECLFARGDRKLGDALEIAYRNGARFDGWQEHFKFDVWLSALEEVGIEPERYTQTLPVGARLPWDHIEIGLEPDFLQTQYRQALASRLSPPCGKPVGDKVHHTNLDDAESDARRLVCYDCGIACDMSQMRDERIVALRSLSRMTERRLAEDAQREQAQQERATADIVPRSRLIGRLAPSNLDESSAFKHNAEAPHSRLRLVFGKHGPLRFLSHLDLLRIMPRMFRRAGIELGFSRGYNPVPRMSFGPALALGMRADAEVVDVDLVLSESAHDMTDAMTPQRRAELAAELLQRLRGVAPPGLALVDARLIEPGEHKLGQLVSAADYEVELEPEQARRLQTSLAEKLAGPLVVTREVKPKKRKGKRRRGPRPEPTLREVDVHEFLMHAELDADRLRFRLRVGSQGGVRPREVVQALLGDTIPDHRFGRRQLLTDADGRLRNFVGLGPRMKPPSSPKPAETAAGTVA
jgi:radical SAM-linked protein